MNERPSTSSKIEQQQIPSTSEETDTGTNSDETVVAKELTVSSTRRNRRKRRKILCGKKKRSLRRVLYMALTIAALWGVWAAASAMSYSPHHDSVFSGFRRRRQQAFGFNNWTDFNENSIDTGELLYVPCRLQSNIMQ